ncbi:heavy metal-binding domain-containing protein [Flavobacterium sp. SM2513]|uniref:heavy metal-binding domain-containing protein n=1 Tax=Flavobacterium sp. SM2513 TaxID=3424766 RepID=UPI003D7F243C
MKKTLLLIAFAVATLSVTSCKSEPKTETMTETTTETTTATAEVTYACPMDCEKGKTYTEMGKCPVCEMDLVASNEADAHEADGHDHDNHEGHNH